MSREVWTHKLFPKLNRLLCFVAATTLLALVGSSAPTAVFKQEEEDETRRLWNKQFLKAREKVRNPGPSAQAQTAKTKQPAAAKSKAKPGAVGDETVDGELIGITIWRLRPASAGDDRVLVQKNGAAPRQYALERATAGVLFEEGQLLRISVEAPREYDNYLYVVDREIYENGAGERLGEPNLIFPARSTPRGGNVISAGKSVYVPAQGDPLPYFTLRRSGGIHVGERLIVIISPKPLPVNVERPALDPSAVAQWKSQCGGRTEMRELRGGMGKQWAKAEQEADEGKRKLVQSDPLPQTIYHVRAKRVGCALAAISLRIAQLQQGRMGQGVRGEDPAPAGRKRGPVSGADVDRLVAQLVRIRELDKARFEEILATPIKETDSNGSWTFHEFEISHGPFAKGDLRLEVGARRALLSLFPPEDEPIPVDALDLSQWGELKGIDSNPHVPPEGADSFIYNVLGVKVWFVFWHGSWTLRSVSLHWG